MPLSRERCEPSTRERFSAEERKQFATALMQVCKLQKNYGKTEAEFATMVQGFLWVLEGFTMPDILSALRKYVRAHADIPAPADLVNLLDPPAEPLSAALYVSLQKRAYQGEYLMRDEREFCEAFRAQEMAKVRGGSDTLRAANEELESWKQLQGAETCV